MTPEQMQKLHAWLDDRTWGKTLDPTVDAEIARYFPERAEAAQRRGATLRSTSSLGVSSPKLASFRLFNLFMACGETDFLSWKGIEALGPHGFVRLSQKVDALCAVIRTAGASFDPSSADAWAELCANAIVPPREPDSLHAPGRFAAEMVLSSYVIDNKLSTGATTVEVDEAEWARLRPLLHAPLLRPDGQLVFAYACPTSFEGHRAVHVVTEWACDLRTGRHESREIGRLPTSSRMAPVPGRPFAHVAPLVRRDDWT